jgi:hypothetical protein
MTALEVIGSAGIWAFFIACGVFLGLVAFSLLTVLFDRWRIDRAFWRFKGWGYLSEQELNDYLHGLCIDHGRNSRSYELGMRAAAKHLLRDHVKIVKLRRKKEGTALAKVGDK